MNKHEPSHPSPDEVFIDWADERDNLVRLLEGAAAVVRAAPINWNTHHHMSVVLYGLISACRHLLDEDVHPLTPRPERNTQ